jgi:tRNA (guanine37-N1)-methyltransferase
MIFDILTIFPRAFAGVFDETVLARGGEKGLIDIRLHDIREEADDPHRQVDDYPFGGGPGMVMKPEPLARSIDRCLESGPANEKKQVVVTSPAGRLLDQELAARLGGFDRLIIVCGRYKGIDQRIIDLYDCLEVSIGDFVLSGGEPAALVLVDAVARLIPGVLGDFQSAEGDSFQSGLLDCPHYTRPREFRGLEVPETLLSGDHARIRKWMRRRSLMATLERRPDLLGKAELGPEDKKMLNEIKEGLNDESDR